MKLKKISKIIGKRLKFLYNEIVNLRSHRGKILRRGLLVFTSIFSVILLMTTVLADLDNTAVYVLYVGNKKVGPIHSVAVYENAREDAESYLAQESGVAYRFPNDIAYCKVSSREKGDFVSKTEITDYLIKDAAKYFSNGYGLYIDNKLIAIGRNEAEMQEILDEAVDLYRYLYAKVKTADDIIVFASNARIEKMSVPASVVKTKEEIRNILGFDDSMSNLNDVFLIDDEESDNITIEDITELMPKFSMITDADISMGLPADNIYYVGSLNGTADTAVSDNSDATMSFKSSSIEVCTEFLDCGEKIEYDNTLSSGKKVLHSSGKYGIKEVTYEVTYMDGVELTRNMLSEEIVKEPVPKVYKVGTKKTAGQDFIYAAPGNTPPGASGSFIFPTSGRISSTFSSRDLFGKPEFHGALDIANKAGTPVYASDGGKVILAEWFDTYGKCIIIDHGNGFSSLYAHLSSYSVRKGDVVGQGWQIGTTGMTGRVTGNHLHFEIRINDKRVNPQDYLDNAE